MNLATQFFLLFLLILANGAFAMAELAIVSSRKLRLEQLAASGSRRAEKVIRLLEDPNRFLSTVQIGITFIGTVAGVFGGAHFAQPLSQILTGWGVPEAYAWDVALGLVVLLITYLSLTCGELVPKRIALANPEGVSMFVAGPMRRLSQIAAPIVALLSFSTNLLLRLLPASNASDAVTEDDIRAIIRQGAQLGVLTADEQEMLDRMLRLDERRVSVIMTPRRDIICLSQDASRAEILQIVSEHQYSRYPVCGESIDDVLGIVHLRDLIEALASGQPVSLPTLMTQPLFVLDSMRALRLLREFKTTGNHVAIVQTEFGGVHGIVTLNDLFESIVGSLPESGDLEEPDVVQREDGSWLVNGSAPIDELRAHFVEFSSFSEPNPGYETLGGFIMTQLGKVPAAGDSFVSGNLRFEVVDMDDRRVDKVLIEKHQAPPAPAE